MSKIHYVYSAFVLAIPDITFTRFDGSKILMGIQSSAFYDKNGSVSCSGSKRDIDKRVDQRMCHLLSTGSQCMAINVVLYRKQRTTDDKRTVGIACCSKNDVRTYSGFLLNFT